MNPTLVIHNGPVVTGSMAFSCLLLAIVWAGPFADETTYANLKYSTSTLLTPHKIPYKSLLKRQAFTLK